MIIRALCGLLNKRIGLGLLNLIVMGGISCTSLAQSRLFTREEKSLSRGWQSLYAGDTLSLSGFEKVTYVTKQWTQVSVPHNWDDYGGYRRLLHGNLHGYAAYRLFFSVPLLAHEKHCFLVFEGVGSYATVWINGQKAAVHAGGRTSFTVDITPFLNRNGRRNLLAVRADHPAGIDDLPWVCGGCFDERGFSEGSQPLGIFRPVRLLVASACRFEPFGIHLWNDTSVNKKLSVIHGQAEIKNYGNQLLKNLSIRFQLLDASGQLIAQASSSTISCLNPSATDCIKVPDVLVKGARLWNLSDPYLYHLKAFLYVDRKLVDTCGLDYGIRWTKWVLNEHGGSRFLLNGQPVFINGIAEYEHLLGGSHAFWDQEIMTRAEMIKDLGFNAVRDAHQPHNFLYQRLWASMGILWWPQFSAHIWFDKPAFKQNFLKLLSDWVRERRNDPTVILWGLQNESQLPEDFAKECTKLIRSLDPQSEIQRPVTTCNGGTGTDWNVPQNWTGTYGGDPNTYGEDLVRQQLVGEYGAWRSLGLHRYDSGYVQNGNYDEESMCQILKTKILASERVRNLSCGQFLWLFNSHDNPGRVQGGEGVRDLDRIGPVNYKGLLTSWEEPTDAYYLYRAFYTDSDKEPMVYILSHTDPGRFVHAGLCDSLEIYTNCEEVVLYADSSRKVSLGRMKRTGPSVSLVFRNLKLSTDRLYAVGLKEGQPVAVDVLSLPLLAKKQQPTAFVRSTDPDVLKPEKGYHYLYRVNCGGDQYRDHFGNLWAADVPMKGNQFAGYRSWASSFPGMAPGFASQRRTYDPISGTRDELLFQTFRYGRSKLEYFFPLSEGTYRVECYFIEPWWGRGGEKNCAGWRLFDVAFNGDTCIKNLDIWAAAGVDRAVKKIAFAHVKKGENGLWLRFPAVYSGQAVISAIAVSTLPNKSQPVNGFAPDPLLVEGGFPAYGHWLDIGDTVNTSTHERVISLPAFLYGASYLKSGLPAANTVLKATDSLDIYLAVPGNTELKGFEKLTSILYSNHPASYLIFHKVLPKNATLVIPGNLNHSLCFFKPVTEMEPVYDLRHEVSYKALDAFERGTGRDSSFLGKPVVFWGDDKPFSISWKIETGLADMHSFAFQYACPEKMREAVFEILEENGSVVVRKKITFPPTAQHKWGQFSVGSGTMINAGHYRLRLSALDAGPFFLRDIKMN